MIYERILAGEALKRIYNGNFKGNDCGSFHVWSSEDKYNGSGDPLDHSDWGVTILGAIFLLNMKFQNAVISYDDKGGNWWSNSLVERTILTLTDFQPSFIARIRGIYGYGGIPSGFDVEFKAKCENKTKYLLTMYLKTGYCPTQNWESKGIK